MILLAALLFVQCESDETTSPVTNSLTLNGESFTVSSAVMIGVSIDDEGHTGITLISGTDAQANTLTIDVESFTSATIEGDYTYPAEDGKKVIDEWLTSYVEYDGTDYTSTNLKSGEVSIIHNGGSNYTLEMDLLMEDESTFTGTYSGAFQVVFNNL